MQTVSREVPRAPRLALVTDPQNLPELTIPSESKNPRCFSVVNELPELPPAELQKSKHSGLTGALQRTASELAANLALWNLITRPPFYDC